MFSSANVILYIYDKYIYICTYIYIYSDMEKNYLKNQGLLLFVKQIRFDFFVHHENRGSIGEPRIQVSPGQTNRP